MSYLTVIVLTASAVATIMATLAISLAIWAFTEIKSFQKSTHQIQYMPIDNKWASSDKEVEEFNENNKPVSDVNELDDLFADTNDFDENKYI